MVQDGALDSPQTGTRLDAELLDERSPRRAVDRERFGLPAATVERDHQLLVEPLAERVTLGERLQLTDQIRMTAEGQICVDPVFDGASPQLFQARDLRLDEQFLAQIS